MFCQSELPVVLTNPLQAHLPMMRKFEGLISLKAAYAYLQFGQGKNVREILHSLKYGRRPELAEKMGRMMAIDMLERGLTALPDLILPVPMHPDKEHKRGYNQAFEFARGLALHLNAEATDKILVKERKTETQTRKNKLSRILNVEEVFSLEDQVCAELKDRHIWLVDDVLTTGSTLLSAARELQSQPVKSLSIAVIAMA